MQKISAKLQKHYDVGEGLKGTKLSGAPYDIAKKAKESKSNIPASRAQRSRMNGQPVKK